jgi:hypothetical protein
MTPMKWYAGQPASDEHQPPTTHSGERALFRISGKGTSEGEAINTWTGMANEPIIFSW